MTVPLPAADLEPPRAAVDVAAWRAALGKLPIEARCELADQFDPVRLHAERVRARDAAITEMMLRAQGSIAARAAEVARELSHYAATAWRFDQERETPRNPKHRLAHRILRLNNGAPLAARSLRRYGGL